MKEREEKKNEIVYFEMRINNETRKQIIFFVCFFYSLLSTHVKRKRGVVSMIGFQIIFLFKYFT